MGFGDKYFFLTEDIMSKMSETCVIAGNQFVLSGFFFPVYALPLKKIQAML